MMCTAFCFVFHLPACEYDKLSDKCFFCILFIISDKYVHIRFMVEIVSFFLNTIAKFHIYQYICISLRLMVIS